MWTLEGTQCSTRQVVDAQEVFVTECCRRATVEPGQAVGKEPSLEHRLLQEAWQLMSTRV